MNCLRSTTAAGLEIIQVERFENQTFGLLFCSSFRPPKKKIHLNIALIEAEVNQVISVLFICIIYLYV